MAQQWQWTGGNGQRRQRRLGWSDGGNDPGLDRGACAAGANRVVSAVVWLSQAGHSGCAGLSYGGGRGSGAGRGTGGGTGGSSGHGRGWEGKTKGVKSHNPLPSSYKVSRVAEEPFSSNFRYYSEFGHNLYYQKIKFLLFDYTILDKNYYNTN